MSKDKKEEALIKGLLAIIFPLEVIQSIIIFVKTYEQKMIEIGNENEKIKNKYRCIYFHHMPILPLLGGNNRLPLLHMAKLFICIE